MGRESSFMLIFAVQNNFFFEVILNYPPKQRLREGDPESENSEDTRHIDSKDEG